LYRIATNVCLDTLAASNRTRIRPLDALETPGTVRPDMELPQRSRETWVEPIPDRLALPADDAHTP
jgi:DNA-directed RNA polymerase specialized sigma24 family protein